MAYWMKPPLSGRPCLYCLSAITNSSQFDFSPLSGSADQVKQERES